MTGLRSDLNTSVVPDKQFAIIIKGVHSWLRCDLPKTTTRLGTKAMTLELYDVRYFTFTSFIPKLLPIIRN